MLVGFGLILFHIHGRDYIMGLAKSFDWIGLSTDTKPVPPSISMGALAYEVDTGDEFVWNGATWLSYATNGVAVAAATAAKQDIGNVSLALLASAIGVTAAGTPATAARVVAALASTGTQLNVVAIATSVTVLAANSNRLGFSVFNDSVSVLYLLLSASGLASAASHSVQVEPGALFENQTYAGIVKGSWGGALSGSARVTEFI